LALRHKANNLRACVAFRRVKPALAGADGGSVEAGPAPGRGTVFALRLPLTPTDRTV
jgi:hypothetical protein